MTESRIIPLRRLELLRKIITAKPESLLRKTLSLLHQRRILPVKASKPAVLPPRQNASRLLTRKRIAALTKAFRKIFKRFWKPDLEVKRKKELERNARIILEPWPHRPPTPALHPPGLDLAT